MDKSFGDNFLRLHSRAVKVALLFVVFLLATVILAHAQSPVITQPYGVLNTNASGKITTTGTFQTLWTQSTNVRGRAGCVIENNGSHTMYVFLGPAASALTSTSYQLPAAGTFNCTLGGVVSQDTVSITGTGSDQFYAAQQ
jgi:hypothetical protein